MGIRRGTWISTGIDHPTIIKTDKSGAKPVSLGKTASPIIGIPGKNDGLKKLSSFRQDMLFGSSNTQENSSGSIVPVLVNSPSYKTSQEIKKNFTKNATSVSGAGSSFGRGGSSNTMHQAPEVYSPLFQMANLQLPRDRVTMNAWNRNFYDTQPLVHNCINLHATYPISKINIKCKNQKIEQFFNEMAEDMDLMGILQSIALEIWKLGEVFPYAQLDESTGRWKEINIQNPDYIHVKKSPFGDFNISLRPDAALLRLIQSNNPDDKRLVSQMDQEMIYHIRKGNNIPLDNFRVSHLKMLSSPYDIHGTSIIVSIYKDLMLYDKLRESKFAQADNLVNPITLIKVGGTAEGEYHPTNDDLENYRTIFEAATYDKDFKIITHAGVSVERVGASGAIIDIAPDMSFILDNILFGLMVPKAIITQDGATFNTASIGLEVLKQRYESFRNMMSKWLIRKIFAPISEIQEFYDYKDGEKKLIVPEVDWNQMVLYDMDNYINVVKELANNPQNPVVSKSTLFRSLGLSVDEEKRKIKEEVIQSMILQKEIGILQTLSLGALRSLKPDSDIIEGTEQIGAALPGTPGSMPEESGSMPGGLGEMGGGLGGGGMGELGLPPAAPGPGASPATPPAPPTTPPATPAATPPKP